MIGSLKVKRNIVVLGIAAMLSACGGGGSDPIAANPTPKPPLVEDPTPFSSVATLLPDVKNKFDALCGSMTNVQNAVPIDLNKDGRLDLVFNLWCGVPQNGMLYSGSVPNTLVAFTQNTDGTWTDSTATVFGSNNIDIGGVGIYHTVADLNNDGYADIVFAVNREDGRKAVDDTATNLRARNAVIMSRGNGTYSVTNIGQVAWNYGIIAVDNKFGQKDIVSIPFAPVEAYRFTGNNYSMLSEYDWVTGDATLFFKGTQGAVKALAPAGYPDIGVEVWSKTNDTWSKKDSLVFGSQVTATWISWSKTVGTIRIITLDNKRYIGPSISNSCEVKLSQAGAPLGVVLLSALEIDEVQYAKSADFTKNQFDESGGYYKMVTRLMMYDTTNDKLTRIPVTITGEKTDISDKKMYCGDINNDGYDDVVISDWRQNTKPIIYINNKQNGFTAVKDSVYPTPDKGFETNLYVDLDGDGVRDLLHWPILGVQGLTKVQFQIFKGKRQLDSRDTN